MILIVKRVGSAWRVVVTDDMHSLPRACESDRDDGMYINACIASALSAVLRFVGQ